MKKLFALITMLALLLSYCGGAEGVSVLMDVVYPEQAPYPDAAELYDGDGADEDAYWEKWEAWRAQNMARAQAGAQCSEGLEPFFTSVLRTYLAQAEDNCVLSPANLYMAFALLAEVTDGETREEVLSALGFENVEQLRAKAGALWQGNYIDDSATLCRMAASLWLSETLEYDEATVRTLADAYYASSRSGEMGSDALNEALRAWLSAQTGGLLDDSVAGISTSPETLLALCTTIYLKARWEETFSKSATARMPFHAVSGDIPADFMRRTESDRVWYGESFSAVCLPMENFGAMWVVLPDEGVTPRELLEDDAALAFLLHPGARAESAFATVHLAIPKFDVSAELDLKNGMREMGIERAFDPSSSDFTAIAPASDQVYLSGALHAARVKIDEEGCEAAAFTVMLAEGAAMPPEEEIEFTADRPFLFAITGEDNVLLFAGIVQKP